MNIQDLYAALQPFQDKSAGRLTVPAAGVTAWTDVHALLVATLANQTLSITGIQSFPPAPTANAIVYQGQSGLFPWSGGQAQTLLKVTATFSVDSNGAPQLLIRGEVPATAEDWTMSASLDGLAATDVAAVQFEAGLFLLTSQATSVSDFSGTVMPFANFQGQVATAAPFDIARLLLPTPESRTVAGQFTLASNRMPTITLRPAGRASITLATIAFDFGAGLSSEYKQIPYHDENGQDTTIDVPFSSAEIAATVAFGSGPALRLSMAVLPESDFYTLSVAEVVKPLSSWSELGSLTGGYDLGALIPPAVPAAQSMALRGLDVSFYFPDRSSLPVVNAINFDVMMNVGNWALLPNDILTVQDVGASMTLSFDEGTTRGFGSLYTHFTIVEEVKMVAALSIPRLNFTAELQPGVTVSVESLMAAVMEKLTGRRYAPPVEMEIARLEMSVEAMTRSFGFGTDITTDWSISFGEANGGSLITLAFEGISFDVDYDGQVLRGTLTAFAAVNEGRFFFTATSPGDGVGWGFAGGLLPDSSISVTNLLLGFMYPSGNIPGGAYGVPNLVIDQLAATLATDAANTPSAYTFEGGMSLSWNFSVFPGADFKLSAHLSLRGDRQVVEPAAFRLTPPNRWTGPAPALPPATLVDDDTPWVISGSVEGTFTLYDLLISAGYQFSPANSALSFGIWYKERGIQATVTQRTDPKTQAKESILTVRLGDLSFGEILEYLINLALPGESRRLPSPWDVLYQINFKNLSLVVNLTTHDVEIAYLIDLDLTFARFDSIRLVYKSVNGEGRVYVELTGEFLGQPFGGEDGEPLTWDAINDPAPEVPGNGPKLIDLRYVGMGQHIALSTPVAQLDTVEKVITALKASVRPVSGGGNPLTDPSAASLRYDGNANWMFGLDATILDTVTLEAVFFDPLIYGGVIALAGPRAGPLAGLRFELLYRKITQDIGELSVDLRVPDMFRHLEFGAVGVTLGTIHVDIYTNGNFRVDLGFPHNGDFSLSFAVEVFPFIGEGGFYFAYLTGATSDRVPLITNGEFSPVIEAGLGLAVGLGKDFQAGPLKAGLKIEIFGIFEGVFAPFNPYDKSIGPDNYFWIQGKAGIVGALYGSVDFVIIKAEVSIVARATVSFVVEAHRPSLVDLKLEVTAKAKIKVLFITIHFSFSLTIEQSFTIGSATATPWIIGTNSERLVPHAFQAEAVRLARGGAPRPRLRQQRSQRPIARLTRLRHARHYLEQLTANPGYRSLHWGRLAEARSSVTHLSSVALAPLAWPPTPVFGEGNAKTARVQFVPMFTVADPASFHPDDLQGRQANPDTPANQIEVVLGFVAENSTDPDDHGHEALARVTIEHVHHLDEDGNTAFATMVEAFFRWAAQDGAGKSGDDELSLLALEDLLNELADLDFQQATFGYDHLVQFLAVSLHFEVAAYPTGTTPPNPTSGTFVPLMPPISATAITGGVETDRDYGSYNPVSAAYAANLPAYFQQLLNNATSGVAARPTVTGETPPPPPASQGAASLAELVFSEYFVLLTQAALQGAVALLQNYPYTYPQQDGPSLQQLAGQFGSLHVPVKLARGQRLIDLALATGHHPERLASANPAAAAGEDDEVDIPVEVTPLSIAEDNPAATLATGLSFAMPHLPYQVRSNQSLNDIAAAVPFVDAGTPVTGAAVGTANAALPGLLRAGATLQIPSFTYTPLAGDTAHFLQAFFQVRNLGVAGVVHLDWYEQAIATMNPNVEWAGITTASPPIAVPTAYLDSTPAASTYPIHQGDSLARIAAALALYQAMDNSGDQPVTQPVQIAAMAHPIVPTDTFDGLLSDFPGLTQSALIAANQAAKVLTPLTIVALPPFTVKLPAGQSLQSLATAYDLSLADLVDVIEGVEALFVPGAALTIRDVPSRSVNQLVADLKAGAQINMISTQVSNFLAHGLRIPATTDTGFTGLTPEQVLDGDFTGALYGLADQVGQQFAWPNKAAPLDLTLTHAASDWLSFVASMTIDDADMAVTPHLQALNPRLAEGGPLRAGLIVATDPIAEITLSVTDAAFGTQLPSTTVTLHASPAAALRNFEDTAIRYNFQVTQHWQAAARPTLPGGSAAAAPGEPSLWPLPSNLQQLVDAGGDAPFALMSVPLEAPPRTEGTPLGSYAWAIQIPFAIRRVADPAGVSDSTAAPAGSELGSPWVEGLYLVTGAGAEDVERLYDLWNYLAASSSDSGSLDLLYAPNGAGDAPKGYASDAIDAVKTVLLKTNLSTATREPSNKADRAEDEPAPEIPATSSDFSATIGDPTGFLTLLWEASVVVEGGFYLRYDAGGAGLPDFVFDDTGRGVLQLLCLLTSQTGGPVPGGPLLALNNVAVVGVNVDASASQVYAEQTGLGAPQTRQATTPPGSVGFEISRVDPAPPVSTPPTPEQLAGMLYGQIGYQVAPATGYEASNEAVPQGPAPEAESGQKLIYSQVIAVYPRATPAGLIAQSNPWLPAPAGDPYAGISSTSAASLSFAAHDVFGNVAIVSDPLTPVAVDNRYTDRLAGIGDWPGSTWSYIPVGAAPDAMIEIDGALQFNTYLPDPQVPSEKALRSASAHALKFRDAFYQVCRPGISVTVETSLSPTPLQPPLAPLIGYLSAAYAYTSQIAALPIKTHKVASGQTLTQICSTYSIAAEDLLRDNIDRPVSSLFATAIVTPQFDQVRHNETLNAFAARVGVTAETLLTELGNADVAIVPAGTNLVIAATTGNLVAGATFADYAAASKCTVGDIGRANRAVPGLIVEGAPFTVRNVQVLAPVGAIFDSLVADFAGLGVTTNVEEIATANQNVPDLFVCGGTIATYAVDRRLTAAAATLAGISDEVFGGSISSLIAHNGDLPGLIAQDTRMRVGATSGPPPIDGLRRYLAHSSGLTVADFAAANGDSVMTQDSTLLLPALLDPAPLAATPYGIQSGKTFQQIADLFGIAVQTLGTQDQDIPGLFVPGQTVSVPTFGSVTTGAEDSFASLIAKFPAGAQPSLAQLIDATADQTGLMAPGAALVCPVAPASRAGSGSALTIDAIAGAFLSVEDGIKLAKSNGALAGFLKAGAPFTVAGHDFTVGPWGTLVNLIHGVNAVLASPLTYDAMIEALLGQAIVDPAAKVLLPPPTAVLRAPLPPAPAAATTISALSASLTLIRPTDEIDNNFRDIPEVARATAPVAPRSSGVPATLADFATAVAALYGGALWTGVSGRSDQGTQRQYAVRFAPPSAPAGLKAVRKVDFQPGASFLALPPLANALVSRSAPVRRYASGTVPPFDGTAELTMFQAIDVGTWVEDFLAIVDLALSPSYASAGYAVTAAAGGGSAAFDQLLAAKAGLSGKIAGQLTSIDANAAAIDLAAAQEAIRQALAANLSAGYATDAVIQAPTQVEASFASSGLDAGGHRLAGKTTAATVPLSTATTIHSLVTRFTISAEAVVELLAATPNVLATGTVLSANDRQWTIATHDTLATGMAQLGLTPAGFAADFLDQAPLFRDGALLTMDGYTATAGFGDSLAVMAGALDVAVRFAAVANQDLAGLLTGTVYVGGRSVTITPETSSLAGLAEAQNLPVSTLALLIADQSVLTDGAVLHIARWTPEYSLTPGRIDLAAGDGALTLLLNLKSRAHYRRLFLNLDFAITALEYAVAPAPGVEGYETSKWLQFVNPLPASPAALGGAEIDTRIGQLDIPIPLRAYPPTPRLVGQRAEPTFSAEGIDPSTPVADQIAKAEAWTYTAAFEAEVAAQDTVSITLGFNYRSVTALNALMTTTDPFAALAEYASNAAAIRADLMTLLDSTVAPTGSVTPGESAFRALAELASKVADNWGFVAIPPAGSDGGDGLVPAEAYTLELQTRARLAGDGTQLLDALVLIRAPGTSTWGPGGQIPTLGYLDADGRLRRLDKPEPPPGPPPPSLTYAFAESVPDEGRRTYLVWYEALNSIAYQNARAQLSIARNRNLTPGTTTDERFVYQTPRLTFPSLAVPNLRWDQSLLFATGAVVDLPTALATLFGDLLGQPPTAAATEQNLAGRYGYRLAAAGGSGSALAPEDLVSMTPMFYRPNFAYDDEVPADTEAAVAEWFTDHVPHSANIAFLSFGIQIFSMLMPERKQPLMDFTRLDFVLTPPPDE